MIVLFLIGIVEMVIVTFWTKAVTKAQVVASGTITIVNIFIWYYVLDKIVNDIKNFNLVLVYALGCSIGTMLVTFYLNRKEKAVSLKENELSVNVGA